MDINDYSTKLSQARMKYNDANNEVRKNYKENLENLEDLHEAKEAKQAKNYSESKSKLENQQSDYIGEYNTKTKETIQDRTKDFQDRLANEKGNFEEDRSRIKEDFDKRLEDLRETYSTRDKETNAYNEQRLNSTKNRYDTQVGRLNNQLQEDIHDVSTRANSSVKENLYEANKEKRTLINGYEKDKREVAKGGSVKNAMMMENHAKDLNNLREAQESQIAQIKDHQNGRADSIKENKNDELKDMQKNFRKLTDEISTRNQKQRRYSIKENEARKAELERGFSQDLYQAKREMAEKIKGGDQSEIVQDRLDHTIDSYEDRIKNIYNNLDDGNFAQEEQKERMANSFADTTKDLKFKQQVKLDDKDMQFKNFRKNELANTQGKADKAIDTYKKELRSLELRNEAQAIKDKNYNKQLLTNQRKSFGETVNTLNDKNRNALTEIQRDFTKEKVDIIENNRISNHKDLQDTREAMRETMEKKEMTLNERNQHLIKENENLVKQYDEKLTSVQKKANKEISRLNEMNERTRVQQENSTKRLLESKERENALGIMKIRNQYDQRLSKAKEMADQQIEKTVEYYEDLLGRERTDYQNKLQSKLSEAKADYTKLREQTALEKETMTQQFEDRIAELRQAHQEAIEEKANDYKTKMFQA